MKRVTATEARRNWFRLLDEVVAGEVVVLDRNGARLTLRRDEPSSSGEHPPPDYSGLLRAPEADQADEWSWEWRAEGEDLPLSSRGSR